MTPRNIRSDTIKTFFEAGTAAAQLHKMRTAITVHLEAIANGLSSMLLNNAVFALGLLAQELAMAMHSSQLPSKLDADGHGCCDDDCCASSEDCYC
jgi:hypothetical protein